MGVLNSLFGKKEKREEKREHIEKRNLSDVKMEVNSNNDQFFEYYDNNTKPGQMYDTTRIIVKNNPIMVNGTILQQCLVSWFNENDAIMFSKDGKEQQGSRVDYKEVIAGMDLNKMKENPEYLEFVVKGLLEKNRVERYIGNSLKTEEELSEELERALKSGAYPCGKYVGEVGEQEGKLKKMFNQKIGQILHNTPDMKEKRNAYQTMKKDYIKRKIAERRAEIERLKKEAELYERDLAE